ncbi:MAG TPA: nuclear transport factor 2 family protein [Acidimicrobiales bacterium]|nr:nuclear transport factor 2 family protein [Acidimicrobiales bacterium]
MELWELVARESIRDLVARYNANGDSGRFEQMLALFAEDGVMELVAADGEVRRFEGVGEIATIFIGTKAGWDEAAAGTQVPHHIRHFVTTHQIDLVDASHATGRSYYAVLMAHGLDHWGRYLDDYEERDGRWRITRRRALTDGRTPGGFTE